MDAGAPAALAAHSHPNLSHWGACLLALLLATCAIRYHKNSFRRLKDAG